jgi:uncharacterized delta-60 repeat protein
MRHPIAWSRMLAFLVAVGSAGSALAAPGDLDTFFNMTGVVTTPVLSGAEATSVVLQLDGKIVAAGNASNGTNLDFALVRYDTNGALDPTFGGGTGKVTTAIGPGDDQIEALIQQTDGKLVAAGLSYDANFDSSTITVVRYLDDGTPDPGFGGGTGKVTTSIGPDYDGALALIQQTDDKLVVAGYSGTDIALVRYETNGNLDMSFNGTGKVTTAVGSQATALALLQQAGDQKLVISGSADNDIVLARYGTTGTLDSMFNGTGIVTTPVGPQAAEARALIQQAGDGKLVVAGVSGIDTNTQFTLVRYGLDGTPDSMFGTLGIVVTPIGPANDEALALAQQDDGKLVVAGSTNKGTTAVPDLDIALVRYDATGMPDSGFGTSGIVTTPLGTGNEEAEAIVIQPNGGIVVAGYTTSGVPRSFVVARYLSLTGTTTTTTTANASTTSTTLGASLVPGGPLAKTNNDCYLELRVSGVGSSQVQKHQVVTCTDGDPCDRGPCGDNRCDVEIAGCSSQTDPALPDCTPPASLDKVKIGGALGGSVGQLLAGPACTSPIQVQVPVKITKKGKYQARKSKVVIKGNATAPKGVSPRKDKDKWTIQCVPRPDTCPN